MTIEGKILIEDNERYMIIPSGGSRTVHFGGNEDGTEFVVQDFGNNQPENPNGGLVQVSGRLAKNLDSQFLVREPIARDSEFKYEAKLNGEQVIQIILNHHA